MFVASNALRVPTFKPDDVDVCQIAVSMQDLKAQMNDIKKSLQAINDRFQSSAQSTNPAGTMNSTSIMAMANITQPSWASLAVPPDVYQPIRHKVIGAGTTRPQSWHQHTKRTDFGMCSLAVWTGHHCGARQRTP